MQTEKDDNTGEHIIFMKECRKQNLHLIECTKSMIIAHVYHCIYQQRWKIFIFIVCRMYTCTCLWYTVLARARILVLSLMLVQSTQKHVYIFVHKGWNQFNIFFFCNCPLLDLQTPALSQSLCSENASVRNPRSLAATDFNSLHDCSFSRSVCQVSTELNLI